VSGDPFGLAGQVLDGQYRIERPIGEGGFSVVYRGMNQGIGEPIAVKCLKLTTNLDTEGIETFTRRFRDEGRLLYRLGQGNLDIVRVVISGTTTSPVTGALVPYMVLEWLDGHPLSFDFKTRRDQQLRGRSLEEMIALFEAGVLGLDHAHKQGVVHRDVKPGNLFLAKSAAYGTRMKVLDFGLAKILDDTIGITLAATVGNFMMCSPRYAAPEQFDPKIGPIGTWTDVYSLAIVLLESLRDARVRKGDGLIACMSEAIDPNSRITPGALGMQLPRGIDAALTRATSLDVHQRQRSAGELWGEIKAGMRDRLPVHWQPAPGLGSTLAMAGPASSGADTIVDPVYSVPDAVAGGGLAGPGGTMFMLEGPKPSFQQPPSTHPMPNRPSAQPQAHPAVRPAAGRPAGGPVTVSPPISAASQAPKKGSRAPLVVFLVLLVLGLLAAGGYFAWREWKVRHAMVTSP
jgi:serine/threonine-protein kinase